MDILSKDSIILIDQIFKTNFHKKKYLDVIPNITGDYTKFILEIVLDKISKITIPKYTKKKIDVFNYLSHTGIYPLYMRNLNDELNLVLKNKNNKILDDWINLNSDKLEKQFTPRKMEFYQQFNIPHSYQDLYNIFVSSDVLRDIENNIHHGVKYTFHVINTKVSLILYSYDKIININLLNRIIKKIAILIELSKSSIHKLDIKIWLTNKKKKFGNDRYLGVKNINSGCTIRYSNLESSILIWRQEECEKVLVHELIHALGIDFHHQSEHTLSSVVEWFDIHNKRYINLFEAYTETWAILFNSIINCYLLGYSSVNSVYFILYIECLFNLIQSSKILSYYGYQNFDQLYGNNIPKLHLFNQGTSVFAYFIIKTLILFNFNHFFKYCIKENNIHTPWKFSSKDTEFLEMILSFTKDRNFHLVISNMMKTKYKKTKLGKSLRMSLFEFNH